jgi:hypothetical protein
MARMLLEDGMKYINWKTILTSFVSLILIGLLTAGGNRVAAEYLDFKQMKTEVAEQSQQMKQMKEQTIILRKMADDVAGIKKNILTVTGKATIRDFCTDACVRINTSGKAAAYAKMDRARITNLTSSEMPSVIVKIEGTFMRSDENDLVILSNKAGSLLDAKQNVSLSIRIEPVE